MRKKKLKKVLLVIGIIIVALFLCKSIISKLMFKAMCSDDSIQTINLKGAYHLDLHQINCGATTGYTYNLTLVNNKEKKEVLKFEMLSEDDPVIKASMDKQDKLTITYGPSTVIYDKDDVFSGIPKITFNRLGKDFKVPSTYKGQRKTFDTDNVWLFSNSIQMYLNEEIPAAQIGYATPGKGAEKENWNKSWLVVGDIEGDFEHNLPIFIHTSQKESAIYVGKKINSHWQEVKIASNYKTFQRVMKQIDKLSDGRDFPEDLKTNPVKESEIKKIVNIVNNSGVNTSFWEDFLLGVPLTKSFKTE